MASAASFARKNLYQVLGVQKTASKQSIKKAFYDHAKKLHPDATVQLSEEQKQKNEEIFKEISQAYQILSNDEKRKEYDFVFEETYKYSEEYNPFRNQKIIFRRKAAAENGMHSRRYNFYDAYEREYYEEKYTSFYGYKSPEGFYSAHYSTDPFGEQSINWKKEADRHRSAIIRFFTLFGSAVLLYSGSILLYKYFYLNEEKEQNRFQEMVNMYYSSGAISAQQKTFLEDSKIKNLPAWYKKYLLENEKATKQTTLQIPSSIGPHGAVKQYGVQVITDPNTIQKIQQHSEDAKQRRKKQFDASTASVESSSSDSTTTTTAPPVPSSSSSNDSS